MGTRTRPRPLTSDGSDHEKPAPKRRRSTRKQTPDDDEEQADSDSDEEDPEPTSSSSKPKKKPPAKKPSVKDSKKKEKDTKLVLPKMQPFPPETMESMVTIISDNTMFYNVLYRPAEGNQQLSTAEGAGKYKTEIHWLVAKQLWQTHPSFGKCIQAILDNPTSKPHIAARKQWELKVKNVLKTMQTTVSTWINGQQETGAGLLEEERSEDAPNALKAQEKKYPWFSAMKDLIESRPNCINVGLGNSHSAIDLSILQSGVNEIDDGDVEPLEKEMAMDTSTTRMDTELERAAPIVSFSPSTPASSIASPSRAASVAAAAPSPLSLSKKSKPAEAGSSTRATAPTRKKNTIDSKFSEAIKQDLVSKDARAQASAALQASRLEGQFKLEELRLNNKHKEEMAKIQRDREKDQRKARKLELKYGAGAPARITTPPPTTSLTSPSSWTPSHATPGSAGASSSWTSPAPTTTPSRSTFASSMGDVSPHTPALSYGASPNVLGQDDGHGLPSISLDGPSPSSDQHVIEAPSSVPVFDSTDMSTFMLGFDTQPPFDFTIPGPHTELPATAWPFDATFDFAAFASPFVVPTAPNYDA